MRLLISLLLLAIAVAVGLYAALPWLVSAVVTPRLGEALGAAQLTIDLGHPGIRGVTVNAASMKRQGLEIELTDADLEYDLASLLARRATDIRIASLVLTLRPTPDQAPERPEPEAASFVEDYLTRVPADRLRIEALEVALPASGFAARGDARLEADVLAMRLTGVTPEFARDLQADVMLDPTGELSLRLEDPDDAAPSSVRVDGRLAGEDLPIDVAVSLDGSLFRLVQETLGLPVGTGRLRGTMHTTLPGIPTGGVPDWRMIEGSGDLALEWAHPELGVEIRETRGTFESEGGMIDAQLSSIASYRSETLGIGAIVRDGRFRFDGSTVTSVAPAAMLTMESEGTAGELELRSLDLTIDEPVVALTGMLEVRVETNTVRGDVEATIGLAAPTAGSVAFAGKVGDYPVELSVTIRRDGPILTADGTARSGPVLALPLAVRHDLDAGLGRATTRHRLEIDRPILAATMPGWSEPFDLDRGAVEIDGSYAWGDASEGILRLGLNKVRANYEDYVATSVGGDLHFGVSGADWRLAPSALQAGLVDVGFPVTDVELTLSGDGSLIHVEGVTARLLGGTAVTGPFDYEVASGSARLVVELADVDLQALLALEGDDITGTGRLDGELPVLIAGNTPSIAGGRLRARGPGTINLASSLAAAFTQPGMDIALKALENFSYDLLESDVEYRDDGDLLLGLRIHGRNPEIEKGRPIHYNLNISENVPTLLRSLRLTDAVSERIEKKVLR